MEFKLTVIDKVLLSLLSVMGGIILILGMFGLYHLIGEDSCSREHMRMHHNMIEEVIDEEVVHAE